MNESLILAEHIARTNYDDLPRDVVSVSKRSLLDTLGVILAANRLGEGCQAFVDLAMGAGGKKESTILGFSAKVPAFMAAFANGSMVHALDFEDTHDEALNHPNAATIPAALAVAESLGDVNGKQFLTAIILGSDLVCRLGLALNINPQEYGWFMPPILHAFGATAAACKLMDMSAEQILSAFSLTLCQVTCSAELVPSLHSVVRSIRDAFSAKAGVVSALLAAQGVRGFSQPIEGKAGLLNLYSRGGYDPAVLTNELGRTFECANVSFKPWPSCRGTHPYIDAVLQLVDGHNLDPSELQEIKLVISPTNRMLCEPLEVKQKPATAIGAKFSLPFVVATALVHRRVTLDRFSPEALLDLDVLDVARKVTYEVDTTLTLRETTQGYVEIRTGSTVLSKRVIFAQGHPKNPMSEEALIAKFEDCARYSFREIPQKEIRELVDLVLNLERVEKINVLTEHL